MRTLCTKTKDEFVTEIMDGLLPAQKDFCEDVDHLILAIAAGFGSGKTRALCAKVCLLCVENPGKVGAVFEPTFQLIRDVFCRAFDDFLEEYEIEHSFRVSPMPEYIIHTPAGSTTILCRATETFQRIRGQTLAFICADELDTSPQEVSSKAVEMMLARLRGSDKPQLAIASTPEGFKTLWMMFASEENKDRTDRRLIKARTQDNPWLPDGFVKSLQDNYPPQLLAAYLEGNFVNLESTTVYYCFDRDQHFTDEVIKDDDRVYMGLDLNVNASFCVFVVRRGDELHVVREECLRDTPAVVSFLHENFARHIAEGNLVVIPDAASKQRSTSNAKESDLSLLRKGGIPTKVQSSNPKIEDRVNAVVVQLLAGKLRVHNSCKYLIRAMEQQAYDRTGKPTKLHGGGKDDPSGPCDSMGYAVHFLKPLRRYQTGGSAIRVW